VRKRNCLLLELVIDGTAIACDNSTAGRSPLVEYEGRKMSRAEHQMFDEAVCQSTVDRYRRIIA
jgi:hypothetical protein